MKTEDFLKAIEVISRFHSTKLRINYVESNNLVGDLSRPTIRIEECCASVINELKMHGFSLSMHGGMLHVEKYQ